MNSQFDKKCLAGLLVVAGIVAPGAAAAQEAAGWKFSVMPYFWLPGVKADVKYGPPSGGSATANLHADESDVLSNLQMALMIAGATAKGETVLENAARGPEIVDLAQYLNLMGAKIEGAGTDTIRIQGVSELSAANYEVMPDRIEAGTFMIAAAITGGDIRINGMKLEHLDALAFKMQDAGVEITSRDGVVRVKAPRKLRSVNIKTRPYPGFPTDMQAQFMAMMCVADGASVISENIFENRFMHVSELLRFGADITVEGNTATVKGGKKLSGAPSMATDLRASASLILAGLAAEGTTEVTRIYHLDRGYESIEKKLAGLGADIIRVKE